MNAAEMVLLIVLALASLGYVIGILATWAEHGPAKARALMPFPRVGLCAATLVLEVRNVQTQVRCVGGRDPRCAGRNCTEHCLKLCGCVLRDPEARELHEAAKVVRMSKAQARARP